MKMSFRTPTRNTKLKFRMAVANATSSEWKNCSRQKMHSTFFNLFVSKSANMMLSWLTKRKSVNWNVFAASSPRQTSTLKVSPHQSKTNYHEHSPSSPHGFGKRPNLELDENSSFRTCIHL